MSCSNCYNGCAEIVSDKCVKYTGLDVPILEIQHGDPLSLVEEKLTEFLVSALDGTGIKPVIDPSIICHLVDQYLVSCEVITATDLFKALIQAACNLQLQIDALNTKFDELEQGYTRQCLPDSVDLTNTFDVLQATINKLCVVSGQLDLLELNVDVNYVKLEDLDALIQAYLDSQSTSPSENQYTKMVPYTVVEYYPPNNDLSNFDVTGAGIGTWQKVYLCNGRNGTPDKRGRSPIGSTDQQGGNPLDSSVAPAYGNPTYNGTSVKNGQNKVTLDVSQIPSHSHLASATSVDSGHTHGYSTPLRNGTASGSLDSHPDGPLVSGVTASGTANITTTVTITPTGLGQGHDNVHPVLSCYYIMYIP